MIITELLDVVNGVIKKNTLDQINTTNHIKPSVIGMNVDFVEEKCYLDKQKTMSSPSSSFPITFKNSFNLIVSEGCAM